MRVLQLGPYPPPHGGVQSNLVAIRNYLRSQGATCGVINLTRHRSRDGDEVYFPKNAAKTVWLIAKLPYDILHLHIGGNLSFRLLALGLRSEERRVGKECRAGGAPDHREDR